MHLSVLSYIILNAADHHRQQTVSSKPVGPTRPSQGKHISSIITSVGVWARENIATELLKVHSQSSTRVCRYARTTSGGREAGLNWDCLVIAGCRC